MDGRDLSGAVAASRACEVRHSMIRLLVALRGVAVLEMNQPLKCFALQLVRG